MIDPTIIDAKIVEAKARDNAVTARMLAEIARLPVCKDLSTQGISQQADDPIIQCGNRVESGMPQAFMRPFPENGSYAYQLYSSICFMVDARAELKLLELIASPHFYAALMKSAGMASDADQS
jgi:hypothetical protein